MLWRSDHIAHRAPVNRNLSPIHNLTLSTINQTINHQSNHHFHPFIASNHHRITTGYGPYSSVIFIVHQATAFHPFSSAYSVHFQGDRDAT